MLPDWTECLRVLLGFTGFYWVSLGLTCFVRFLVGFEQRSSGFTGFQRILMEIYWVLPSFLLVGERCRLIGPS